MASIVLTGGGTAGHCTPNLALVKPLGKKFDKIYYIGSRDGLERRLALNAGLPYYFVTTVKLERKPTPKNLALPFLLSKGVREAKVLLKRLKPSVVFSKGGYVSLPVVIAAKKLKIPVVSHESDLSAGLANRIAAGYSVETLTAFKKTAKEIKNGKYMGTPIREELFAPRNKREILSKYGLSPSKKTLLVTGGSQGAEKLNSLVYEVIDQLCEKYNVILIAGKGKARGETRENFYEVEFTDDVGELFHASDLAVSRAGANTLFELISLGIPTLAVPLPKGNSRGDQIENAEYLKGKKLVEVMREENADGKLLLKKIELLDKNSATIRKNCLALDLKNGAAKIAEEIISVEENFQSEKGNS